LIFAKGDERHNDQSPQIDILKIQNGNQIQRKGFNGFWSEEAMKSSCDFPSNAKIN